MKKLAVIIGRFNPVHLGHVEALFSRVANYDKALVILGSAHQPPNPRNPFNASMRAYMISATVAEQLGVHVADKLTITSAKDYIYVHDRWLLQIQNLVNNWISSLGPEYTDYQISLVAADKDRTSFYVHHFPQWKQDLVPLNTKVRHATDIRRMVFEENWEAVAEAVSPAVLSYLMAWRATDEGKNVVAEDEWNRNYEMKLCRVEADRVRVMPYAPTYMTVDAVITWRGNVLLIERKSRPGMGLLALPGGFLEPHETLFEGALREAQEETKLTIVDPATQKLVPMDRTWNTSSHPFDHPLRSLRGRIVTMAFRFAIPDHYEIKIRAASDARKAMWLPLGDALSDKTAERMFEDHQAIIAHLVLTPTN
jgi:bifunctional NMN adenylyltransferase/nudix hydrolase